MTTTTDPFINPCARPEIYLTADIPGTGGELKQRPEDFIVEELPLYEPAGDGEHLMLFIEKRRLTTNELSRLIAKHFKVRPGSIGIAGQKDKEAVTRQYLTVHLPGRPELDAPPDFNHDRASIIWADRHVNKLRKGHLAGNRFIITIRNTNISHAPATLQTLKQLERAGVPNRAGVQRFGMHQANHLIGRADLLANIDDLLQYLISPENAAKTAHAEAARLFKLGDYPAALEAMPRHARTESAVLRALAKDATPERAIRAIDHTQRRFWVTAFQSAVFNRVLDARLRNNTLSKLSVGDIAVKHRNGANFHITPEALEEPNFSQRITSLEISPTGPIWGASMLNASAQTGELELQTLSQTGVTPDHLSAFEERARQRITGDRRPLRVPLTDPDVEAGADEHGQYIRVTFTLPPGAFATVALDEIMKSTTQE